MKKFELTLEIKERGGSWQVTLWSPMMANIDPDDDSPGLVARTFASPGDEDDIVEMFKYYMVNTLRILDMK